MDFYVLFIIIGILVLSVSFFMLKISQKQILILLGTATVFSVLFIIFISSAESIFDYISWQSILSIFSIGWVLFLYSLRNNKS